MDILLSVKQTQIQMLRDRGYGVGDETAILGMTSPEFEAHFLDLARANEIKIGSSSIRPILNRIYRNEAGETLFVYYAGQRPDDKSTKVQITRNYLSILDKYRPGATILIINAPLSSTAKKEIYTYMARHRIHFQLFFELDLTYNPTLHADAPRHQRLPPAEKLAQLEEMRVRITDLPLLRADDPIAKYYGWDAGDLIRIYRPTSTLGGITVNYRAVIAPFSSQLISTGGDETGPSHTTMDMAMQNVNIPDVKPDREIDYLHYN